MKRLGLLALAAGCAHARTAATYRADTADLLAAQEPDFKACYDKVLAIMPAAAGHLVVHFTVEPGTGRLGNAAVDMAKTTTPDAVNQCVLLKIPQLSIPRGDRNRGDATWSWDFVASSSPS